MRSIFTTCPNELGFEFSVAGTARNLNEHDFLYPYIIDILSLVSCCIFCYIPSIVISVLIDQVAVNFV